MQVVMLTNVLDNGTVLAAGSTVDVAEALALDLIGTKRATYLNAPTSNPASLTKEEVEGVRTGGPGSFVVASQAEAETASDNVKGMTALRVLQSIVANAYQALLTGISFGSSADVTAADSIRSAIGKLQAKFNNFATLTRAAGLTGLSTATNAAVTAGQTILEAFGRLQAQADAPFGAKTTIASASTVDIGAAATRYVEVTGTTAITSLGTPPRDGMMRRLRTVSSLTLTNNANILLLGGANRATTAGEIIDLMSEGTAWREVNASPNAVPGTGGSFAIASQAEAEVASDNTKGMTPLRVLQSLFANFSAAATANGFLATLAAAVIQRYAGVLNAALMADGNTYTTARVLHMSAPMMAFTVPASTFGATPTAENDAGAGNKLRLVGAGAVGLVNTAFAADGSGGHVNCHIHITTSAGVPSGVYKILAIDTGLNKITLDVAFQATTVTAVARANLGEIPWFVAAMPGGFFPDAANLAMSALININGTGQKTARLYVGSSNTLGASGAPSLGAGISVAAGGSAISGGYNLWGGTAAYTSTDSFTLAGTIRHLGAGIMHTNPPVGNAYVAPNSTPVVVASEWQVAGTIQIAAAGEVWQVETLRLDWASPT